MVRFKLIQITMWICMLRQNTIHDHGQAQIHSITTHTHTQASGRAKQFHFVFASLVLVFVFVHLLLSPLRLFHTQLVHCRYYVYVVCVCEWLYLSCSMPFSCLVYFSANGRTNWNRHSTTHLRQLELLLWEENIWFHQFFSSLSLYIFICFF